MSQFENESEVAGIARKALEERTGTPVITPQNAVQLGTVVTNMISAVATEGSGGSNGINQ